MGAVATVKLKSVRSGPLPESHRLDSALRILAVDGRAVVRSGLARLAGTALGCETRGVADLDQARVILKTQAVKPDAVLLLGIRPDDEPAALVEAARLLRLPVICVLGTEDATQIHAALAAEADGYLLLELLDLETVRAAVAAVRSGERVMPAELSGPCQRSHARWPVVTARCLEVLRLLADGLHDEEIGQQLGISTSSVRKHIFSAEERLGARTRTQAVGIAVRRGLL